MVRTAQRERDARFAPSAARYTGLGDRRRCGPPPGKADAASAGERDVRGTHTQDDQEEPGDEFVDPGDVVGGVAEEPRADRAPGAAQKRAKRGGPQTGQ